MQNDDISKTKVIQDIELFPDEVTLTWDIPEPNATTALELLERRLKVVCQEQSVLVENFKLNSQVRIGKNLRKLKWTAEINNRNFKLTGIFSFVRLGKFWKARIC